MEKLHETIRSLRIWWNVAEMYILKRCLLCVQQEKKWILITLKNISGVYQTKYYYGSVKKSKFSFLKEQNIWFFPSCLVLMRFQSERMLYSAYYRIIFTWKEAEIGR